MASIELLVVEASLSSRFKDVLGPVTRVKKKKKKKGKYGHNRAYFGQESPGNNPTSQRIAYRRTVNYKHTL